MSGPVGEHVQRPWSCLRSSRENHDTEPGGFGAERDEMSLEWAGSRPQVQIPMGVGQEDEGGQGGCGQLGHLRPRKAGSHLGLMLPGLCFMREREYRLLCE